MIFPELFRHDRQGEQAQHVLFVRVGERDAHRQRGDGRHRSPFIDQPELRHPFGHKLMEGKSHVAGLHRCAVMKTRQWIEGQLHPGKIIGVAGLLGHQRIIAAWLIIRRRKKGVVEGVGTLGRHAAQGIAVEVIEGAVGGKGKIAPFWRGGVNVIVVIEIDGIFRLANHRERVALINGLRLAESTHHRHQQHYYAHNHSATFSSCSLAGQDT